MFVARCFAISALLWLTASTLAQAETCNHPTAPAAFKFAAAKAAAPGQTAESGIQPSGFVDLKSGAPTVQGIDVSKFQDDTDFQAAYICGARVAYVQLSSGSDQSDYSYRLYWPNTRSAGLWAGPFHGLRITPDVAQSWYSADPAGRPARFLSLMTAAPAQGKAQASFFLGRLDEVLLSEVTKNTGAQGVQYPPIALDVTFDPLPTATQAEKAQFGQAYAAMACAFVNQIHANPKTSRAEVLLFAEPRVYAAYDLNKNGCGLERLPVWIAYHSVDGDRYDGPGAAADASLIANLCRPGGAKDRCVMQQYSSAASFAVFTPGSHLHLDRFYGAAADLNAMLQSYK